MLFDIVDQDALVIVLGEQHFVVFCGIRFLLEKEERFGVFGIFFLVILVAESVGCTQEDVEMIREQFGI